MRSTPRWSTACNTVFICSYCYKKFTRQDNLHRHISLRCKKQTEEIKLIMYNNKDKIDRRDICK
jgi:hypothetical protein